MWEQCSYHGWWACMGAYSVAHLCPNLWNHMDYSPPGSSAPGIALTRTLEWVAMPSCRGSSRPKDWTEHTSPATPAGWFSTAEPPGKPWWGFYVIIFLTELFFLLWWYFKAKSLEYTCIFEFKIKENPSYTTIYFNFIWSNK